MVKATYAGVRCALQVALLGAITPNIRKICASYSDESIDIFFYYDNLPSEEEEEISEVVSTEVMCSFLDISTQVHRFVIPYPKQIPQDENKVYVYSRFEKTPTET